MAFTFVRSGGSVIDPATISMFGSGIIAKGEVVDFVDSADYQLAPSGATSTRNDIPPGHTPICTVSYSPHLRGNM